MSKCHFCNSGAVAGFFMPEGCWCYPKDREQVLCMQHVIKATPLGGMELIGDFTVDREFSEWWHKDGRQ